MLKNFLKKYAHRRTVTIATKQIPVRDYHGLQFRNDILYDVNLVENLKKIGLGALHILTRLFANARNDVVVRYSL